MMLESKGDRVLQEDLEYIVNETDALVELQGKTVLVTGATGLIGSQIIKTFQCANRRLELGIRILALARSEEKVHKIFENVSGIQFVFGDIRDSFTIEEDIDYIIHCASVTSSRTFVDKPAETIDIAVNGTKNMLELAKEKQVDGFAYLSSLEVYGVPNEIKKITETDYGYMDPLQVRSSYSEGKRMSECLCVSYAAEYDVPIKIARLSQTFGAGVEYQDGRVFAEFARCVIEKKDIELHTQGNTVRTFCYTRDAISAIINILVKGNIGEAYNVTNEETAISIKDMAELVCKIFPKSNIKVCVIIPEDIEKFGYNPEMKVILDGEKLNKLGWKPSVNIEEMYARMICSMQERSGK